MVRRFLIPVFGVVDLHIPENGDFQNKRNSYFERAAGLKTRLGGNWAAGVINRSAGDRQIKRGQAHLDLGQEAQHLAVGGTHGGHGGLDCGPLGGKELFDGGVHCFGLVVCA